LSLARLWGFLGVALPVVGALIANLSSVDLAYHLRAGAQILDGQGIPTVDSWTYTAAGLPWTDQQWGAQVVLATIYRVGGWNGLVLVRALLVGVVFWALFEIGRRRGLGMRGAAWLSLAAFVVSVVALGLRPQLLGMTLFALVLLLVSDRRTHPGRVLSIPLIVLVWANLHGSFFLGPLVLVLAWLEDVHDRAEPPHRLLRIAIASAAAACVTPFGPAVWAYAVGLSTNPAVTERISEWQPTSLRDVPGLLFFGSVLVVVALIARRGRSVPWPTLVWLAVFLFIGAYAIRGVAWWSLGAAAAVAGTLASGLTPDPSPTAPRVNRQLGRLNGALAIAIVAAAILLLPLWRPLDPGLRAPQGVVGIAPPGITAALRDLARSGDRLFQPQPWGSWFEFALPDLPVVIDSRIELFPVEVWDAYERVAAGVEGWQEQLADWHVTMTVVAAGDTGLSERLSAAGWRVAYEDGDGSIAVAPGR
jgi:hypothetical protein